MTADSKFFSTIARSLLFSVAMAVLGLAWGCGEVPSQNVLDAGAEARVQRAKDSMQKFMEKQATKRAASKTGKS